MEEYAGKGDILNDAIGHPERYTERHVATKIVGPLLRGLSYLHANNIMHRCVAVRCVAVQRQPAEHA